MPSYVPDLRPCKLCGASIFFAKSLSGAPMPLDAQRRRVVVLNEEGRAQRIELGYESHFATCPQANRFRKPTK